MKRQRKEDSVLKNGIRLVVGTIGSYIGIMSNLMGAILGILASILVVMSIAGVCVYVKVMPDFTKARTIVFDKLVNMSEKDFIMNGDTQIYDCDGKRVGSVNAGRYKYVKINHISPYLYNGYIAVEDKRFKTHGGVDFLATMRAGVALAKHNGAITQGGSTITQQVIKNNLLSQEKSFTRKMAEVLLAPSVEKKFGKDKIMEFYCNSNYYGNRCYGVQAASKFYFGKKCDDIEPQEAAMLIGLSNSPSGYDPITKPKMALKKRNLVLSTMFKEGVITRKEYLQAVRSKLKIVQADSKNSGRNEGYVVSYAVHCAAEALMEKEDFPFRYSFSGKKDYETYQKKYNKVYGEKCRSIRSGGYKIYTSINMDVQRKLQKSVDEGLAFNTEKNSQTGKYALQGAAVCVDNTSNYVIGIVGGRGTKDQYNRAYLSARQSGSSIKPLVDYTPGFESGLYAPSTVVDDHKIENGPSNAGGGYRGKLPLREAVARSLNTVAWQVLQNITPKYGLSFLDKLHFRNISYVDNDNLAVSLGGFTKGVRVVDMAKGFSALANNGSYSDRTCVTKIYHASDGIVYQNVQEKTQVYLEDTAWMMTDVLKGVLNQPYGTGRSLKLSGGQIAAGKTGTTNSSKDVWFCGYTSYYTTVVWSGFDTPRAMPGASGASIPGVIWKNFMNQIHVNKKPQDFERPKTVCLARYDINGNMVSGTERNGNLKKTAGYDYFSTTVLKEKAEFAEKLKDAKYQKKIQKKLENFEKITIKSMADYYVLQTQYNELKNEIAAIADDDIRTSYMTRLTNKYESLHADSVSWKKVVKAYEKQKKEEAEELARESKLASEKARKEEKKRTAIALARTRLKRMTGYEYCPDNIDDLILSAESAVEACKSYSEYTSLLEEFNRNKKRLESLPKRNNNKPENQNNQVNPEPQNTTASTGEP